jgi:hypothetical protein
MTKTRRCVVRLKDDGSLDLDWRYTRIPWWKETEEEWNERLLNSILRNNPALTREEAQSWIDWGC